MRRQLKAGIRSSQHRGDVYDSIADGRSPQAAAQDKRERDDRITGPDSQHTRVSELPAAKVIQESDHKAGQQRETSSYHGVGKRTRKS